MVRIHDFVVGLVQGAQTGTKYTYQRGNQPVGIETPLAELYRARSETGANTLLVTAWS